MVAIVSVTAVLVSEPPARAEVAPRGPYATTAQLGDLELNLVVDPAAAGRNEIHLYLTNQAGPADRRRRGVGLGDARQPRDRPAAPDGAPSRPRPLRRPRRAARARRRLAAPRRDSPRRVRRGDRNGLRPDPKGTTLMRKTLILLRSRRAGARARGERARHRQPERGAGGQLLPLRRPRPDRTAQRRHDQGRAAAAGGPRLRQLPAEAGLDADGDDGEAREAGHERRGRDRHGAHRNGDLGGRQDRPGRVRRVRHEREGPGHGRADARLPGRADVLERRGRPLDRRRRRGHARAASHAGGDVEEAAAPTTTTTPAASSDDDDDWTSATRSRSHRDRRLSSRCRGRPGR